MTRVLYPPPPILKDSLGLPVEVLWTSCGLWTHILGEHHPMSPQWVLNKS